MVPQPVNLAAACVSVAPLAPLAVELLIKVRRMLCAAVASAGGSLAIGRPQPGSAKTPTSVKQIISIELLIKTILPFPSKYFATD
jgi:hypothetical protein